MNYLDYSRKVALTAALALVATPLIAGDLPTESSCGVFVRGEDGKTNLVVLPSLHVLASTTQEGAFKLPIDAPAKVAGMMCGRSSLIPAPNDYKLLQAGFTLAIVRNDESEARTGVLEIVSGRLQFRMIDGVMTKEETNALQPRLNEMQQKIDHDS